MRIEVLSNIKADQTFCNNLKDNNRYSSILSKNMIIIRYQRHKNQILTY